MGKSDTLTVDTTNNSWASDFCWTNNHDSYSIYGNPIKYPCAHPGNNTIFLTYNSVNYCDNNDFYLTDSTNIYITEPIGDINLSLDTINNTITANTSVSDTIGWSYSWRKDNADIPNSNNRIISYSDSGYYCCTIKTTDLCTQQKCQQLPEQSSPERDSCQNAEIEILNQCTDICQGIVKYRVINAYPHVNWQIDSNIQNGYYNDTITIIYNEAKNV